MSTNSARRVNDRRNTLADGKALPQASSTALKLSLLKTLSRSRIAELSECLGASYTTELEQLGALCDSFDSVLMELKRVELKSMCAAAGVSDRGRKLELVLRLMGKEIKAPTPEEERWRTAIHEAGHVLLHELYDLDYSGVTLNPEEQEAAGLVMRVPMASLLASKTSSAVELREFIQRIVMVGLGGLAAERIVCHTDNGTVLGGAHSDTTGASQLLGPFTIPSETPERERRAWLLWLLARTGSVIRLNLEPLEAVARELLRCGELSRSQVQKVLKKYRLNDGEPTQEAIQWLKGSLEVDRHEGRPAKSR
ncbi:hypothetical protein KEG38_23585 [Polyangium jinanense]|uniref:hypothetical protein n=1 Tax=Polyangium jinanense TaxID=2829994 RepID=UPI002340B2CB|nr:hypothetical protein [Polyangium jinanense]MDC3956862.1 hypothetical protein [Polyangium jinanense]